MKVKSVLPLEPPVLPKTQDRRIWIGNLDIRLTEYTLIKLLQKYGKIEKFDFLYHKKGPLAGQPRGYCFVTYEKKNEAETAVKVLNGKMALSKKLSVRFANEETYTDKQELWNISSTSDSVKDYNGSISDKIAAIETKLKRMEEAKPNVESKESIKQSKKYIPYNKPK